MTRDEGAVVTLLGGLEVRTTSQVVLSPQVETVLAFLVAHNNTYVTVADLVDEVWGDVAPKTAVNTIQVYVSRIRRALRYPAGLASTEIRHLHGKYVLRLQPHLIDAERFIAHVAEARRVLNDGAIDDAVGHFEAARRLWHSEPLSGVQCGPRLTAYRNRLVKLHEEATQEYASTLIGMGRHSEAIPPLEELVTRNPYRETAYAHLMIALMMVGRRLDALRTFTTARQVLRDRLGLDPSPELVALHQRVLNGEGPNHYPESVTNSYGTSPRGPRPAAAGAVLRGPRARETTAGHRHATPETCP
ncbi:AfsR/SARP family transcriptional regulator [Streptomyces sp. G45]|uniref:AfsR/SARP family transcriptional regulator n=1 Tax=Streptomyces sp. G45 TaxID=3406627 RepID=UPI003C264204